MKRFAWILPICLLVSVGCHQCPRLSDPCKEPCKEVCETIVEKPCPPPMREQVECPKPKPRQEIRQPEEVHVKLPPQKIVINQAQPALAAQQMAPAAAAGMPMQMGPTFNASEVTSMTSAHRAIPAIGIDWVNIRLPLPRLFAVPTEQEVTMRMRGSAMQPAYAVQNVAVAAQPAQMVPAQMMQAQMVPAQMVPAQMMQTQMVPAQMVPTQMVQTQMVPAQLAPAQLGQAQAACVPQASAAAACQDPAIEELTRQLTTLDALLKERERQMQSSQRNGR